MKTRQIKVFENADDLAKVRARANKFLKKIGGNVVMIDLVVTPHHQTSQTLYTICIQHEIEDKND